MGRGCGCGEGNDGGSIPRRYELVTLKQAPEQVSASEKNRLKAVCCSLSDIPLKAPVVVCELGKLYNKEAVIEYLLERKMNPEGEVNEEFRHLKSLKDVKVVIFEPNPDFDELEQGRQYPFLCPITREMFNGIHGFVVLRLVFSFLFFFFSLLFYLLFCSIVIHIDYDLRKDHSFLPFLFLTPSPLFYSTFQILFPHFLRKNPQRNNRKKMSCL